MYTYLKPIIEEINLVHLYITSQVVSFKLGVTVHTPCGDKTAKVVLLASSADLPARAMLMNMKRFNRKFGCLYCEHPGETSAGNHLHRFWPFRAACPDRTHISLLSDGKEAVISGKTVRIITHMYKYLYDKLA